MINELSLTTEIYRTLGFREQLDIYRVETGTVRAITQITGCRRVLKIALSLGDCHPVIANQLLTHRIQLLHQFSTSYKPLP